MAISQDLSGVAPSESRIHDAGFKSVDIQDKYDQERNKRMRPERLSEFVDLYDLPKFRHHKQDPWVKEKAPEKLIQPEDGSSSEILILGAGWSGMITAVRLIQAGHSPNEIRIVDIAGGFGGTWYWNRYPGLFCDVESYIYMPLLEETGYFPKQKYSSGKELREHAERIAEKWDLNSIAYFLQRVTNVEWNDGTNEWTTTTVPQLGDGKEGKAVKIKSRFVVLGTGILSVPHVPVIPGIEKFKGACFHTARWDYNVTGGNSSQPDLTALKDKKVGILGTGATAVQVVPNLAKWAKELSVFQRTPSSVDRRNNRDTDPEWARKISSKPGWQRERTVNFHSYVTNAPSKPEADMVGDGWTHMPSYSALTGTEELDCGTPEKSQKHLEDLHLLDLPRQEGIRRRVDEVVKDPTVAEKLKPWYPGWCKRPCFHDEYLNAFNQPNVNLVDTNGIGISEVTEDGVKVGDQEYKLDVLVLSTGYKSLFVSSPGGRVGINITGRGGRSFDKKWAEGVSTLHGMMTNGFPNLFWPGLNQGGGSPNFTSCIEVFAEHVIALISQGANSKSANGSTNACTNKYRNNFTIEATAEGEENWAQRVMANAGAFAGIPLCTPNTFNAEGKMTGDAPPEELLRNARLSLWAHGPNDFANTLKDWRNAGTFEGLEIASAV